MYIRLVSIFFSLLMLSFQASAQAEYSEQDIKDYIQRVEFFDQHCYAEGSDEEYTDDLIVMEGGGFFACEEEYLIIQSMHPEMEALINEEAILTGEVTCESLDLTVSENIDEISPVVSLLSQRTACQDQEKIARSEKCGEEMTCNGLRALRKVIPGSSIDSFVEKYAEKNNFSDGCLDDSRGNCLVNAWAAAKANWSGTIDAFGALLDGQTWSNIFSKVSLPTWSSLKNRALKTQENVSMLMSSDGRAEMFLNMQKSIVDKVDPWLRSQVLCQKWAGEPHNSECLEKLESLDCLSCSEYTNALCAAISVLASEGALLFATGGTATITSLAVKGTVRLAAPRVARVATRIAATAPELSAGARASNRARAGSSVATLAAKKSLALAELAGKMGTEAFKKMQNLVNVGKLKIQPVTDRLASAGNIIARPANYAAELGEKTVNFIVMRGTPTSMRNVTSARTVGNRAVHNAVETTSRAGSRAVIANRAVRFIEGYANGILPTSQNPRSPRLGAGGGSSNSRSRVSDSPPAGSASQPNSGSTQGPGQGGSAQHSQANPQSSQNSAQTTSDNSGAHTNQNSKQNSKQNSNNENQDSRNRSNSNIGALTLGADVLAKSTGLGQSDVQAELASLASMEMNTSAATVDAAVRQTQSEAAQARELETAASQNTNGGSQSGQNPATINEPSVQSAEQAREVLNRSGKGAMSSTEYEQTRQTMEKFYAEENRQKVLAQIKAIKGVDEKEAKTIFDSRRSKVYDALDYMADAAGGTRASRRWEKFEKTAALLQAEINLLEKELATPRKKTDSDELTDEENKEFNPTSGNNLNRGASRRSNNEPMVDAAPTPSGSRSRTPSTPTNASPSSGVSNSGQSTESTKAAAVGTLETAATNKGRAPASVEEVTEDEDRSETIEMESLLDEAVTGGEELPWNLDEITTTTNESQDLLDRLKEIKENTGALTGQYSLRERDGAILHEFKIGQETFLFDVLLNGRARLIGQ